MMIVNSINNIETQILGERAKKTYVVHNTL